MNDPYTGLIALGIVVAGFLVTVLFLAATLGPKFRSRTKQIPFECGSVPVGDVKEQRFNIRFYLVAMLFILFDIEVIFLYPWAVTLPDLGWFAFLEMLSFMMVLGVGLLYVWRKGILNWND